MTDALPPPRSTCLSISLAITVVAMGGFLGFAAQASLSDPMTAPGSWSQWWGFAAATAAACATLGGGGVLLTRWLWTAGIHVAVTGLLGLAVASAISTAACAIPLLAEAEQRGGDWHGLNVAAAWFMCLTPAALAIAAAICLVAARGAPASQVDSSPDPC